MRRWSEEYLEHFRARVLQDALNEATAAYWIRRAEQFAAVANARCTEIASACCKRAFLAAFEGIDPRVVEAVRGAR